MYPCGPGPRSDSDHCHYLRVSELCSDAVLCSVQVGLSCCTLKCKITISEIENGWLVVVVEVEGWSTVSRLVSADGCGMPADHLSRAESRQTTGAATIGGCAVVSTLKRCP